MKRATVICLSITLSFLYTSCEDEKVPRDYPRVRTLEVTNITEKGALFSAEVYEPGNTEITEHGFTWALSNPDIEDDDRVLLGPFSGAGQFSSEIKVSLSAGEKYKVSAFIKAGDYTVYGNSVEFTSLGSLGPEITGFSPGRVLCGDTVLIRGRNFSWVRDFNKVFFNETAAFVCDPVTDTTVLAVVPYTLIMPEQTVSLEISGSRTTFADRKLIVDLPVIEKINPASAHWGDTVEITVNNLKASASLRILFGQVILVPVVPWNGEKVSFIVPWETTLTENQIKITAGGGEFTSPSPLILLPPVIDRITPQTGLWGDDVMLFGSFNRLKENSSVTFGQHTALIKYYSRDTLIVKVPDNLDITPSDVVYSSRQISSAPVKFGLKPPEIVSVNPMTGPTGTIVRIDCKNIKYPFVSLWLNDVEIGWDALGGYSYDETYLECRIKGSFNGPATFRVTVCGQSDTWEQPFMVRNPYIVSFSPQTAIPGDTITIVAENYLDYVTWFSLSQGILYGMQELSREGNIIKVLFSDFSRFGPPFPIPGPIYAFQSTNATVSAIPSANNLVQPVPVISSFTPVNAEYGDEVTVTGANFSLIKEYNHLSVGGWNVVISEFSRNELKFTMPNLHGGTYPVELELGGYKVTAPQNITCSSAWTRLPDLPFNNRESFVMDFNGDILVAASPEYQSTVTERNIYRYDPATGRFNQLGNKISCIASYFGLVVKGDRAYISRSNSTLPPVLDVFDRNTLTLSKVSDLPASGGYSYWLMDGDSVLLAGLGSSHWKFNPATGKWTRLGDLPGATNQGHVFTIGGRNFLMTAGDKLFEYDGYEDRWIQKNWPSFGLYYNEHSGTFVCNSKAYVCFTYSGETDMAAYDPVTDSWEPIYKIVFPLPRTNVLGFSLGDILYLGGGNNYLDFWSFDTSF